MCKIVFLILLILVVVTAIYCFAIRNLEKENIISKRINLLANIATIIGVTITFIALIYAYKQYETYKNELLKKPDIFLKINPVTRPPKPKKVFNFKKNSNYSDPAKIMIKVSNKGEATTDAIHAIVSFNNLLLVDEINNKALGFQLPMKKHQIFMLSNRFFPLPPHFPFLSIMEFTVRLSKDCMDAPNPIGRIDLQGGGGKYKSFFVYFNSDSEEFYMEKNKDISYRFNVAPLNLKTQ